MAFFSFRSILQGGETQDKEAPDEAFVGKFSQHSPSVVQSCGAVSKHPTLLEPRGGSPAMGGGGSFLKCCCMSM